MTIKIQQEEFIRNVNEAIIDWDKKRLVSLVMEGLEAGFMPLEMTGQVLLPVLQKACREIDTHDISFPELVLLADTIKAALDVLIPKIKESLNRATGKGKVIIGTVKGDIHELGKNLVAAVFESGGYHVTDLGKDVSVADFIGTAEKEKADIIAASTLLTPTLISMEELLKEVRARKLKVKTIIGGWATSPEFARKIGADAWADDALEGLFKLDRLMLGQDHD
ncbi:MAG: Methionine synthase [Syntrophorhabdus sp. PtaU1.Bin058]|nr:MAG: Methionine synthase [Syntrophorhabdus sp. PtaU1.Bin058]